MLAALVAAAGGEPWVLPTAADNASALDAALAQAASADLLLISGGCLGRQIRSRRARTARIGARFHFTGVRIQPGQANGLRRSAQPRLIAAPILRAFPAIPSPPPSLFFSSPAPVLAALAGNAESHPASPLARLAPSADRHAQSRPHALSSRVLQLRCRTRQPPQVSLSPGTAPEI